MRSLEAPPPEYHIELEARLQAVGGDTYRVLRELNPSLVAALYPERFSLSPSYERVGEMYEARGRRKKAADYYGRFVDLWQKADPELQPAAPEVRARLAQLAREPNT